MAEKKQDTSYLDKVDVTSPIITDACIDQEIIQLVLLHKYFYSHFLQQFRRHIIKKGDPLWDKVPTLGVNITDDLRPNLFVNEAWYGSLTPDEKLAVLEHEVLHILNKHLIRKEGREPYLWNLASDVAINQYIKGLPNEGLCPDCNILVRRTSDGKLPTRCNVCNRELDPKKDKWEALDYQTFKLLKDKKLPKEEPTECYYDLMNENLPKETIQLGIKMTKEKTKGCKECGGFGNSNDPQPSEEPQDGEGSGGQGEEESDKHGCGQLEIDGVKVPMTMDPHEIWETGSDNQEMAHEKIKEMVRSALDESNQRQQGHLPDFLRGLIDSCIAHKILNWKSELRRFVGYEEFAKMESTRKKTNRRYGVYQPGTRVVRKAHIAVIVDSSGSVSNDEFAKFFKEIEFMKKAGVGITIIECDADVQSVYEYKKRPTIERIGYGGTDFRPPFKLLVDKKYTQGRHGNNKTFELRKSVDCIIYLTDGYGSFPTFVPKPTIWVMTPNYQDPKNPALGKVIVMKD